MISTLISYFKDALPLLSEAIAILYWTRLSERYGRKRILLCGAVGVSFALTCFGFSRTLPTLILSRSLQGALNANAATVKTMFGEITEGDELATARAFSFLPIVWAMGSTLACVLFVRLTDNQLLTYAFIVALL